MFVLGQLVAGGWVGGIIPALIAMGITYYFLARRTGKQLEVLVHAAVAEFQAGRLAKGRTMLESGFELGKWQFLIKEQIHAQIGSIEYMQRNFKAARSHLNKSWKRNWSAQAMLASIDYREKKMDKALERMEKAEAGGRKDPLYWALYAFIAVEAGKRDQALEVLSRAVDKVPDSKALKSMADSVRNKKKLKMKAFAPGWYNFFPEQMPRQMATQSMPKRGGYSYPMPRK